MYLLGVCQLVVGLELVVDLRVLLLEAPGVELRNVVVASRPHRRRLLIRRLFILVECRGIELRNVLDRFSATCSLQLGALLLALKALQKKEKNWQVTKLWRNKLIRKPWNPTNMNIQCFFLFFLH